MLTKIRNFNALIAVVVFFFRTLTLTSAGFAELPAPLRKCRLDDEQCTTAQGNTFLRSFPQGIPELDVPKMEPYELDKIAILDNKQQDSAGLNLLMTDIAMHKFSNMNFSSLRFTPDSDGGIQMHSTSYIPELIINSKYNIDGKLLFFPLKGAGDMEMKLYGISLKARAAVKRVPHKDKEVFEMKNMRLITKIENATIQMSNLFEASSDLSESIGTIINENWRLLTDEMLPKFNEALSNADIAIANKILKNLPADDFFLKD